MPIWLASLFARVVELLTVDLFRGIFGFFSNMIAVAKRGISQKDAAKKVEQDIQNKAPVSDEQKKHEDDWMNS